MFKTFLLLFVAGTALNCVGQANDPIQAGKDIAIVGTQNGNVKGYIHNGIFTYKGIPYAKAERFMAPEKPSPWTSTRNSMTYGPVCPIDPITNVNDEFEFPFHHEYGYSNEHCQSLNVWTKHINDHSKRPVMVWFHGGGFSAGSSIELPSYDGESLARKGDVVLVSVNHRLNSLGFLDLSSYGEKYKYSANAGLLDLIASLQWVKDNIEKFGGDPNNVTIFGQSGGGGKVTCIMNSPLAKGLFSKAIVESGSYITSFMDPSISRKIATAVLEELNISPASIDSIQHVSYEKLNRAGHKALAKVQQELIASGKAVPGFGLDWGPHLDGYVLPYQPSDNNAIELFKNIPLMVGTTKNEFTPFIPGTRNITFEQAKVILEKKYGNKTEDYIKAVKAAYPETVKGSDYTDIDLMFRPLAVRQANMKSSTGTAPVYMYLFSWQSPVNDGIYKAFHCMDIAFEFDNIEKCQEMTGGGKSATLLAGIMSQAWINFASSGNPNTKGLPTWPAYTEKNGATMIFDNTNQVKFHHDAMLLALSKP